MFIYFSLAGMDELIELFSVINELEKGALGLFFELNYLIGAFLAGYIAWFVNKFPKAPTYIAAMRKDGKTPTSTQAHFDHMYNWIYVQYFYLFFSVFMLLVVSCIYRNMDAKAKNLRPAAQHHDHDEKAKATAINDEE